jgi:hypothetical protein
MASASMPPATRWFPISGSRRTFFRRVSKLGSYLRRPSKVSGRGTLQQRRALDRVEDRSKVGGLRGYLKRGNRENEGRHPQSLPEGNSDHSTPFLPGRRPASKYPGPICQSEILPGSGLVNSAGASAKWSSLHQSRPTSAKYFNAPS